MHKIARDAIATIALVRDFPDGTPLTYKEELQLEASSTVIAVGIYWHADGEAEVITGPTEREVVINTLKFLRDHFSSGGYVAGWCVGTDILPALFCRGYKYGYACMYSFSDMFVAKWVRDHRVIDLSMAYSAGNTDKHIPDAVTALTWFGLPGDRAADDDKRSPEDRAIAAVTGVAALTELVAVSDEKQEREHVKRRHFNG